MDSSNSFVYIGFYRTYREPSYNTEPRRPVVELYGADSIYKSLMTSFIRTSQLELISFTCKELCKQLQPGSVNGIEEKIGKIFYLDPGDGIATFLVTAPGYAHITPGVEPTEQSKKEQLGAMTIVQYVRRKLEEKIGADLPLTFKSKEEVDPKDSRKQDELVARAKDELNAYLSRINSDPDNVARLTVNEKLAKVQDSLDDVKMVMHKTIGEALKRGENIDSLIQKSDQLSMQSKAFAAQAKKQNSCCVVM
ncbi:hypothetical protein AJ79_08788 [Helicocarpus griseus UAMH5409]|uniref:V-SNARE coiled-coil homology domain-containing protein n=1 Tax=Helicocarpus griseus UAMH5409 TaxID=1447875 RepID=A0A2B7WQ05_9EURO|nr:hypothetical protein AJ79_08788 [Helicocarpus griseus UAMH5409]